MTDAAQIRPRLHLDSIEVCRGIAATMVVTYHGAKILGGHTNFGALPFGAFFQFGRSGVDFFFVLSGFLISLLHWRDIGNPARLKHYAIRRVTRIYPTYWLVLLAIVPFDLFTHTLFDDYNRPWEIVKSIFLLPQERGILDVTWSLRNELMFYALFGLMIFNRTVGAMIVAVWIVAMAARPFLMTADLDSWTTVLLFPMNFEFIAGVIAGWALSRIRHVRPLPILAAGLVLFMALWAAEDQLWFVRPPRDRFLYICLGYGIAATGVIVGLSLLEMQGRLRMPRPLVTLGGASYLLYLIHVPALLILGASERHLHLVRFAPGWLLAMFDVAAIVGGAVAAHLLVEKPLLRAVRRLAEPGPRTAAVEQPPGPPVPVR